MTSKILSRLAAIAVFAGSVTVSEPAWAGATILGGVTTGATFNPEGFTPTDTPGVYFEWVSLWGQMGTLRVSTCGSVVSKVSFSPKVGAYGGIEAARSIVAAQVAAGWIAKVVIEPGTGVYPVSSTAGIWHLTAAGSKLVVSGDTNTASVSAFGPDC